MRICYVLLSPTFGMHQYTADLANRMAQAGHDVHLVTTARYPPDRYLPAVTVHTPVNTRNTGFSPDALRPFAIRNSQFAIRNLNPDLVHFTGVHLWNVPLVWALRRCGIVVIHTLHDLDPHHGVRFGSLIRLWNRLIIGSAGYLLVHGQVYRDRLIARAVPPDRVTYIPLLHLCFSYECEQALRHQPSAIGHRQSATLRLRSGQVRNPQSAIHYEPWALFFGRLERYKGIEHLLAACAMLDSPDGDGLRLVLAGPGSLPALWAGLLPPRIEVRNRLIGDEEAIDLFRRCGLLALPYVDATQSALVAAAYFFRKPVVVTRTGALPEYVEHGRTGWVVEPGDAAALADCLAQALSDPARLPRMGQAGRAWYDEQRGLEEETLLTMYERVVGTAKAEGKRTSG